MPKQLIFKMNTPTKRIFYLFGPKIAKNEPQTKVWGSLTCKSQCLRLIAYRPQLWSCIRSRLRTCPSWLRYLERYLENAATIPSAVVWPKTSADFVSSMKMPIRL